MTKRAVIHVENTENLVEFAEFLASEGWTILSANKTEEILRKQKIPVTKENALSESNLYMADTAKLIRRVMLTKYHEEDEPYISHPDSEENNIFIVCVNVLPAINPAIISKLYIGIIKKKYICSYCQTKHYRFKTFNIFKIEVEKKKLNKIDNNDYLDFQKYL